MWLHHTLFYINWAVKNKIMTRYESIAHIFPIGCWIVPYGVKRENRLLRWATIIQGWQQRDINIESLPAPRLRLGGSVNVLNVRMYARAARRAASLDLPAYALPIYALLLFPNTWLWPSGLTVIAARSNFLSTRQWTEYLILKNYKNQIPQATTPARNIHEQFFTVIYYRSGSRGI